MLNYVIIVHNFYPFTDEDMIQLNPALLSQTLTGVGGGGVESNQSLRRRKCSKIYSNLEGSILLLKREEGSNGTPLFRASEKSNFFEIECLSMILHVLNLRGIAKASHNFGAI